MSRFSNIIFLILVLSLATTSVSVAVGPSPHPIQEFLTSPKGVAGAACLIAILNGFANFVWAYDWSRAGASAETKAQAQEAGGLAAAALSWSLGAVVPVYYYLYQKHKERHNAQSTAPAVLQSVVVDL